MLVIRSDQVALIAQETISRRRQEVTQALHEDTSAPGDVDHLVEQWFDLLVEVGITRTPNLVRGLTLLRHHRVRSGVSADWMLLIVLFREAQGAEQRLAFDERHLLPRLVARDADATPPASSSAV